MNHADFKKNYNATTYHGDPIMGGFWMDKPTDRTIEVDHYSEDTRTILPDGRAVVVWYKRGAGWGLGFLKGYTREDALRLAEKSAV